MLDANGRVVAVIHHVTDVTERVRADLALRQLNDTLESQVALRTAERDRIWQLSPNLLLVAKTDGTMLSANPAWERILGWPSAELAGRNMAEIQHPDEAASTAAELARLAAGFHSVDHENRCRHRDGSWRWICWTVDPEGDVIYCNGRDVTEEKVQAEALRMAQEAPATVPENGGGRATDRWACS
jgi:PAS domain S-box-containing protein